MLDWGHVENDDYIAFHFQSDRVCNWSESSECLVTTCGIVDDEVSETILKCAKYCPRCGKEIKREKR